MGRDLTVPEQIQTLSDSIDTEVEAREQQIGEIESRIDTMELNTSNLGDLARCNYRVIGASEYEAIENPDPNTFYFVVDDSTQQDEDETDLSEMASTRLEWIQDGDEKSQLFDIRNVLSQQDMVDNEFLSDGQWTRELKSVRIGQDVTEIGESAFAGCVSLVEADFIGGTRKIGNSAFLGDTGLVYVYLPSSLSEIGEQAFAGCNSIEELTVPEGVSKIEAVAFAGCTSLSTLTLPASLMEIGEEAFMGC